MFIDFTLPFQVTKSSNGSDIAIVTLTISPPDYRIHTVYCTASQYEHIELRKIEIFSFGEILGTDWSLYDEMWEHIRGQ